MKKIFSLSVIFFLIISLIGGYFCYADQKKEKIRIGYVESEKYDQFTFQLSAIAMALQEYGILGDYYINAEEPDSYKVWQEICDNNVSNVCEFVKSSYFTMKDIDKGELTQLTNRDDIDLVIVMGTSAGKYFADNEEKNNFMVFSAADPISANIVKSESERYKANSYAHIDGTRYKRQIQAGYKLLGFKKIGVVYQDTEDAYSYSGIEQLKDASKELGFEIVERHVDEAKDDSDYDRYYSELLNAYKELSDEKIDTLYITTATIKNEDLHWLLEKDIYLNNIATIAQANENQVKYGVLLGVSIQDPIEQGYFAASQIKSYIIDGTEFNQLEQVNEGTPKIYLNYSIAEKIGLKIPFSTLLIVDSIYREGS